MYSKNHKSILSTASQGWSLQIEKQWISESQWEVKQESKVLIVLWKKKAMVVKGYVECPLLEQPVVNDLAERHMLEESVQRGKAAKEKACSEECI